MFGCVIGIPQEITSITIVALGTSLPDTFASMIAAKEDDNADASIGNITGSNSVNVFLGLVSWKCLLLREVKRQQPSDCAAPTCQNCAAAAPN